ncbi:hypothetical protein D9757_011641 [Collybiopsis confluens]|uniref:Uncharacterized protein n=1 Tax=Collybiopsis confluens TaxID=2823264 RepID=A0A8H5GXD9_9AGAR|nr:hypothetical protein D9757_011641 [Collybiopsis confluens]
MSVDLSQQFDNRLQLETPLQLEINQPSPFDNVTPLTDEEMIQYGQMPLPQVSETGSITSIVAAALLQRSNLQHADQFSTYSTPSNPNGRSGTTIETAKKWLFSWLRQANCLHCPVTFTPLTSNRTIEVAHVMLPKSAPKKAVDMLGHILGMRLAEISVHSRLFLMPLRKDIHALLDNQRILLLPNKDVVRQLTLYIQTLSAESLADHLERDKLSPWKTLRRQGMENQENLKEGAIHQYRLLQSPHFADLFPINTIQHGVNVLIEPPYLDFPLVSTHLTPFALMVHAIRVFESPDSPVLLDHVGNLVEQPLRQLRRDYHTFAKRLHTVSQTLSIFFSMGRNNTSSKRKCGICGDLFAPNGFKRHQRSCQNRLNEEESAAQYHASLNPSNYLQTVHEPQHATIAETIDYSTYFTTQTRADNEDSYPEYPDFREDEQSLAEYDHTPVTFTMSLMALVPLKQSLEYGADQMSLYCSKQLGDLIIITFNKYVLLRFLPLEDLMENPIFETAFTDTVKGLPDLKRVVSRIHARNCKVKDFLKVLASFKKLSRGVANLADASESFKSKTIFRLLRSAPDLIQNVNNVENMFEKPSSDKDDELIPREGKDEAYDEVMTEIEELEGGLEEALKKFEKSLGYVGPLLSFTQFAVGTKEIYMIKTSAGQKNIPKEWTKNGGTKAKSRWLVPSLQKSIRSLKEAREKRNTTIKIFKFRIYNEFDEDCGIYVLSMYSLNLTVSSV